jgi:hypothetical protein
MNLKQIAFREGDMWIGQCLEIDICAQAETLEILRDRIDAMIVAEQALAGYQMTATPAHAPTHFHLMWDSCSIEKHGFRIVINNAANLK